MTVEDQSGTHLPFPRADYSFSGDRLNESMGMNISIAATIMRPLFSLGLAHALITRRRNYKSAERTKEGRQTFTLLLDGQLTMEIDGIKHDIEPGNLVYYPRGAIVTQSNPGNSWYLYLTFNDHPLWEPLKIRGAYVRPYESADLMYLLMARIATAFDNPTTVALQSAKREAQMLADLLRREVALAARTPRKHGAALKRLVEEIKQNPEADWTVASMGATACVSARTLTRLFDAEYGIAPIDLVLRERMARAHDLLIETEMKVATVAQAVGYKSVASFSRLFKKQIGKTPGQCRPDPHQ
jgi:AraC-like DNA-binding protein